MPPAKIICPWVDLRSLVSCASSRIFRLYDQCHCIYMSWLHNARL
jgi:hypothetical protein